MKKESVCIFVTAAVFIAGWGGFAQAGSTGQAKFAAMPKGLTYKARSTPLGEPSAATILSGTYTPYLREFVTEVDVFPESLGHILIEVPGPILVPEPGLPPTDGVYRSPDEVFAEYNGPDLQIILQNIRQRPLSDPPPVVTTVGVDEIEKFQMMAIGTAIITMGGSAGDPLPVELTGPVQTRVSNKADQTTGSFQAEIVSMELSCEIPGLMHIMIMMRESPTLVSYGWIGIVEAEGGFFIESFFDLFTELSVDGGNAWMASTNSVRVDLVQPWLIPVVGPSEVHVLFEGDQEGVAYDDDADGFDEVGTELSALDLRGYSSLGPMSIGLRSELASTGQIAELINELSGTLEVAPYDDGGIDAESFFDVWPQIRIGDEVLQTAALLPMETLLGHNPPQDGERYVNPCLRPVELIDEITGEGTGLFVVRQVYQPAPTIEHDFFPESQMYIGLQLPAGEICYVAMKGPGSVDVYFEGPVEGDAVDDDLNGRDEVTTQMRTLQVAGYHPALGQVNLNLNSQELTLGQIEEDSEIQGGRLDLPPFAGGGTAESFFDLFFEIEIPALALTLHNEQPMRLSATITHKPPGPEDLFEGLQDVSLLDETRGPTDFSVNILQFRSGPCDRCGDFDGSRLVDLADLLGFVESWLWEAGVGDSDNPVDMDCDGRIYLTDFAAFASQWLQGCL